MKKQTHCDKCFSKIEEGKCSCGWWYEPNELPVESKFIEIAIETFDFFRDQGKFGDIVSGDHHSGTNIIIFRGDYEMCQKARSFIEALMRTYGKDEE
jgi:hypothetical protein